MHQMCSIHTKPEEFENAIITGHCGFVFEQNRMIILNVFRPYENAKPAFSNPSGVKRGFGKALLS